MYAQKVHVSLRKICTMEQSPEPITEALRRKYRAQKKHILRDDRRGIVVGAFLSLLLLNATAWGLFIWAHVPEPGLWFMIALAYSLLITYVVAWADIRWIFSRSGKILGARLKRRREKPVLNPWGDRFVVFEHKITAAILGKSWGMTGYALIPSRMTRRGMISPESMAKHIGDEVFILNEPVKIRAIIDVTTALRDIEGRAEGGMVNMIYKAARPDCSGCYDEVGMGYTLDNFVKYWRWAPRDSFVVVFDRY